MKKVLLIAAVAMVFAACEKKEECKPCSMKSETYVDGMVEDFMTVTSDLGVLCGDDLKQVDGQTMRTDISSDGVSMETVTTYICE